VVDEGGEGAAAPEREGAGLYVVLRVDKLPGHDPTKATLPGGVRIGEQLTVIRVVEGKSRDNVAREHRQQMEADWAELREGRDGVMLKLEDVGGAELPETFPTHRYRCVSLTGFTPGHSVTEVRRAQHGTF
jgi:hypothetical protein